MVQEAEASVVPLKANVGYCKKQGVSLVTLKSAVIGEEVFVECVVVAEV